MSEAFRNLRESGEYSDVTVKCGPYQWPLHRNILSSRSAYFNSACKGCWSKDGPRTVELTAYEHDDKAVLTADDRIKLCMAGSDNPQAVKLMIDYMYLNDYEAPAVDVEKGEEGVVAAGQADGQEHADGQDQDDEQDQDDTEDDEGDGSQQAIDAEDGADSDATQVSHINRNMLMHAEVYHMASKYGVQGLQLVAEKKFLQAAGNAWGHSSFPDALSLLFATTTEHDVGIRSAVTKIIVKHGKVLLEGRDDIKRCVTDGGDLSWELLKLTVEREDSLCRFCSVKEKQCCEDCAPLLLQ